MKHFPEELMYTESHEWAFKEPDTNIVTIGLTEYAQEQLGELVTVKLPEEGVTVDAGDEVCILESIKTAIDVFSPLSGEIISVNSELEDAPGFINTDPYGDGWLYKIEMKDSMEYEELFDVSSYESHLQETLFDE